MRSKLDSFLRKKCFFFCFIHVVLLISLEVMRKKCTSVGLSYKGVILFSKIFYVFNVVYVKSNSIIHVSFLVWMSRQRCKEREGIFVATNCKVKVDVLTSGGWPCSAIAQWTPNIFLNKNVSRNVLISFLYSQSFLKILNYVSSD